MIFPRPCEPLLLSKRRKQVRALLLPCAEMGLQNPQFLPLFFCSLLFSCPRIFPWLDEFLNKTMVRREQERAGEKSQERTWG